MDENALLTISEVADLLAVNSATVRRRIDAGELAAIRLGEGPRAPIRIATSDVAQFLRRGAERRRERAIR